MQCQPGVAHGVLYGQHVVIAAGGGKWGAPSGGTCVAFALP
jgi:hypothetical protein